MGAVFALPIVRGGDVTDAVVPQLRERDVVVIGLTPDPRAVDIREVARTAPRSTALLLGSERAGLTDGALAAVDVRVRIPMHHGVDSLNVAAAAAIACYALGPPP
jgi:tRNA G18 (ribose-2'-O)-methylase SpoU